MNADSILSPLASRELIESLERMSLIEPGEQPPLQLLTGGVSSLIALATTSRGPICVKRALPKLRVAAEWFARVERNAAEVNWMKQAAAVNQECVPRVLGEDPGSFTFAMEFLPPDHYHNWKSLLSQGIVDLAFTRIVAQRIVEIHGRTAGNAGCARRFNDDDAFSALRFDPYYAATAQAHPECAPALHRLMETTLKMKRVVIHGDLSPKNILAGPEGPVFLDAETAWYGDPAFDLAFCLTHLLLKSIWRPEWTRRYLQAFQTFQQVYLGKVTWEAHPELEARTGRLLAGNLLSRIDGKSPVEYLKDDGGKNFVRRFSIQLLLHPETHLEAISERWRREREDAI